MSEEGWGAFKREGATQRAIGELVAALSGPDPVVAEEAAVGLVVLQRGATARAVKAADR